MGRWGGRSSEKSGARDGRIATKEEASVFIEQAQKQLNEIKAQERWLMDHPGDPNEHDKLSKLNARRQEVLRRITAVEQHSQ